MIEATVEQKPAIKIIWDSAWERFTQAKSALLGNHGLASSDIWWTKLEANTPYFSVNKDVLFYQELQKSGLDQPQIDQIAADRLRRGFLSECWEASRVPEANKVYYVVKEVEGETRVVHESDLHSNLDMSHALTDKIRQGKEKEGILKWRGEWLEHRKQILEAPTEEQAELMATSFGLLSPKGGLYTMSQLNIARFITPDLIEVRQWAQDLEAEQAAKWANLSLDKDYLNPKSHLHQMITQVGVVSRGIDEAQVIQSAVQAGGREVNKTKDSDEKWETAQKAAEINSRIYLNAIKNGGMGDPLNNLHLRLLLQVLEPFKDTAAVRETENGVEIDLNCGPISQVNRSGKSKEIGGFCQKCGFQNLCTSYCIKCGGLLNKTKSIFDAMPWHILMLPQLGSLKN